MRIIKCRKVKFVAYQGGQLVLFYFDWTFVSFFSYVNPLHDNLEVISYILKMGETIGANLGEVREKERRCE